MVDGRNGKCFDEHGYQECRNFTGRLSDEDLQKVTGAAFCTHLCFNFEGFGIPIIAHFVATYL